MLHFCSCVSSLQFGSMSCVRQPCRCTLPVHPCAFVVSRYLTSFRISRNNQLAVKYCANAVDTTNSGTKRPSRIHRKCLAVRSLRVDPSFGTLRCKAPTVKVKTQDTIKSQVPRNVGVGCHLVKGTSDDAVPWAKRNIVKSNRNMVKWVF